MSRTTTEMQLISTDKLVPYVNNARTHSAEQILKLRSSLREFGFVNPIIIDKDFNVIAGHGRLMALKQLGWKEVPIIILHGLTEDKKKALLIADNKIAILHDHEVDHLLKAMRVFKNEGSTDSAFTCKFTIKQIKGLKGVKLDTILDSDIFRVAISDSVIPVLDTFSISYTTVSPKPYMYCFETKLKTQFDVLSKAEINRCIGLVPDGSL